MAIPPFTLGYPPDGSSLGNTKAIIRDNLDGEFKVFSVDHVNQNTAGPGAHNKCSLRNTTGSTTPTLPPGIFGAGYETLYSQPAGSAPLGPLGEVFYSRGGGAGIQITGPGTPTKITNNGYTFLAGGIMMQWGLFTPVAGDNPVTFSPTFSNAVLNISLTTTAQTASLVAVVKAFSESVNGFTVVFSPIIPAQAVGVYWHAIGY
jgi:hypothetical protein